MIRAAAVAMAVCAALYTVMALAAEVDGVKLDDRASVGGKELVLNGARIRTRAVFKVYVASLFLPQKSADANAVLGMVPRRIQLNLLRDLKSDQLVDALVQGLNDANPPQEVAAVKAQTDQLAAIMKGLGDVREKDIVALDFVDGNTVVRLNGESRGTVPGEAFNKALTRVWLGDKPVQSDLKKAMLGGS